MGKLLPAQAILKDLRNSLQNVSSSFLEHDTLLWKRCLTSAQRITDMCYEGTLKFADTISPIYCFPNFLSVCPQVHESTMKLSIFAYIQNRARAQSNNPYRYSKQTCTSDKYCSDIFRESVQDSLREILFLK